MSEIAGSYGRYIFSFVLFLFCFQDAAPLDWPGKIMFETTLYYETLLVQFTFPCFPHS